jgi:hypothetical protein
MKRSTALALLLAGVAACGLAQESPAPPVTAGFHPTRQGFAFFDHRHHPGNRIGYRFFEHTPMVHGAVPRDNREAGIDAETEARLLKEFAARPGVLRHEVAVTGKEWAPQKWTFYLLPVQDGIDMLLHVEAGATGLNSYYGVQQCFRLGGETNAAWRQEIARTPAFSEYDYWQELKKAGREPESLTWVRRRGVWERLPAGEATAGARTPLGLEQDTQRTGGDLAAMPRVGPYDAVMLAPVDDGLITRADRERNWVGGIFWQRTSHVTVHHPADCLHSIVNIGGIPPGGARVLRGRIYWRAGGLEELGRRWAAEFGPEAGRRP